MNKKIIYPSTQLVALLHPKVLKVYLYLLGWQNSKSLKLYTNQLAKATKLTEKDVEISIQSLIDNKLIQVKFNGEYEVTFNGEEAQKYYYYPIKDIVEMELLPVSTDITWNKEIKTKPDSIEEMTEDQMKALILRLQASLKEKEQVKKMIKTSNVKDDLPF